MPPTVINCPLHPWHSEAEPHCLVFSFLFLGPSLICWGWGLIKADSGRESLWLKWRMPSGWKPVRDKSAPNPWPLEQLFLHAEGGLVLCRKAAYVWPGATLPWLAGENESQEKRLNLEYQEKARQGGEGRKRQAWIQPNYDTDGKPGNQSVLNLSPRRSWIWVMESRNLTTLLPSSGAPLQQSKANLAFSKTEQW